ncbi:UNVERIFIED_CONTAM: ATP synthase subunit gamma, mitochondrial [Gekko kuhli]
MATLKDITRRLKSIKNIQKITKSMKMVAAAKYSRAERDLKPARVYGVGALALYEKAEIKAAEDKKKHLLIGVSSDRGLCGAIHTSVAKNIKSQISTLTNAGKEVMVIGVGDKLRGLLQRTHSANFLLSFKEVGRKPPTFGDASIIALELLNSGYEFDEGSVIYNRFRQEKREKLFWNVTRKGPAEPSLAGKERGSNLIGGCLGAPGASRDCCLAGDEDSDAKAGAGGARPLSRTRISSKRNSPKVYPFLENMHQPPFFHMELRMTYNSNQIH